MGNLIGFSSLTSSVIGGNRVLRMVAGSGGAVGTRTLNMGKRNISIADNGAYGYLCVYQTSSLPVTSNVCINGLRYATGVVDDTYCLLYDSTVSDSIPVNSIVLGTVPIAVNANGDLIVHNITGMIEDEDVIFIGDEGLKVVMLGGNWYLCVSPMS